MSLLVVYLVLVFNSVDLHNSFVLFLFDCGGLFGLFILVYCGWWCDLCCVLLLICLFVGFVCLGRAGCLLVCGFV